MDQKWFNMGLTVTLLAALISHANLSHSEEMTTPGQTMDSGIIGGTVSRSTFTLAVVNREPRDSITELSNDQQHIYFFSELKGMTGQTITHRWTYKDEIMAEVKFEVGAPRWRIWSSKTLMPFQTGEWTVSVINDIGEEVLSNSFNYIEQQTEPSQ